MYSIFSHIKQFPSEAYLICHPVLRIGTTIQKNKLKAEANIIISTDRIVKIVECNLFNVNL